MVGVPMIILRPEDCPLRGPLQNFISQHYLDKINTTLINSSVPLTNSSIQLQLEKQQKQMNYVWRSLDSLVAVQWASQWVKQNEPTGNLPMHEHLMIITALDLLSHRNDSSTQGMAYVRAICRGYDSVSIVAAHELAHSIGAFHDGFGESENCSARQNFLMTPVSASHPFDAKFGDTFGNAFILSKCSHDGFGESENCSARQNFLMTPVSASHPFDAKFGDTFGNAFILSKCSKQQIEDFFNSSDSNCLWSEEEGKNLFWSILEEEFQSSLTTLTKNGSNTFLFDDENYLLEEEKQLLNNGNRKEEEIKFLKILPGEQFNPSRQCQIAFGPSYGLCQRIDFLLLTSDPCRRLWCKDRRKRRWGPCETKGFLPLMDGSSCGDQKWCIRGQCRPMPGISEEGNKNSNNEENKSSVNCNDLNHTFCSNFQHSQLHSFCQMISFSRICCSTCLIDLKIKIDF
uniref:Peptidase M12B domain-containing protein n=1 Tax=Meloidogyne incognita TaxID=6306 RepID=A0A914LXS4_MELIC